MIIKVVSGGQTGSDQAGVIAAKSCGIETGGWMPPLFLTELGPNPVFANTYGLIEHKSKGYPPRTFANVRDSDGTLRIAYSLDTPGEKCTLKAIVQYKKPYIDIKVSPTSEKWDEFMASKTFEEVVQWLKENNIQVLNVAGNRESTCPGLQEFVKNYLIEVFKLANNV